MTAVNARQGTAYLCPSEVGALGAFIRARAAEHEARFGDESSERVAEALRNASNFAGSMLSPPVGEVSKDRARLQWDVLLEMAAPWADHRDYDPRWSVNSAGCSLL
ncbi:hypothetical protein BOQ63_001545 (plasmid) [Streptomyces viridifaciens]|nr:hypothetical protein BOQ63_001545 [Streptomyces viridifaciens]